jgi:Tol biopolymer transport system component
MLRSPLYRVSAAGGSATQITTLDASAGETSHRWPWFLPDGRHFLFLARNVQQEKSVVYVGDLESNQRQRLMAATSNAVYAPPGFLLFSRERTLMVQPFDAATARTSGDPAPLAEQVDFSPVDVQGRFSASQNGVLAFYSGAASPAQLTWFDRSGNAAGTVGPPVANVARPAISPDGSLVAVARTDPQTTSSLWVYDLAHGTESRLTFARDYAPDASPVWSRDGNRIVFTAVRSGKWGLYQKSASGAGNEDLLFETPTVAVPTDWSRDGRFIVFHVADTNNQFHIWVLPLAGDRKPFPFLRSEHAEFGGTLSPDGEWLAYQSDESASGEVYVVDFPNKQGKWQVSTKGGTRPVWNRDGKELFYISADGKMMAVEVKGGALFEHGAPRPLFDARMAPTTFFDVSPDGKRFLLVTPREQAASPPMTVVINWQAELKR